MADVDDFDWGEGPVQAGPRRNPPRAAQYSGLCPGCEERIHPGDLILMTDDGAVHEECVNPMATPKAPKPDGEVCTTCWLTHPKGACDRDE